MTDRYRDGDYLARNPTWHAEDAAFKAEAVVRMLRRNDLAPASVVDVGCGSGAFLAALDQALDGDVELHGYDPSPQAIELAAPLATARLRFHQGVPSATDRRFDLALAIDVFEHVDDYLGFLRELNTLATHSILHVPLDLSVQSVLRVTPIARQRREVGHLHYFTEETAIASLEHAGHRIVDRFLTTASISRHRASLRSRLAALPRRALYRLRPSLAARLLGGFSLLVFTDHSA